jgi:hypothetical protein
MNSCITILHAKGTQWHLFGEMEVSYGNHHSEQLQHDKDLNWLHPKQKCRGLLVHKLIQ